MLNSSAAEEIPSAPASASRRVGTDHFYEQILDSIDDMVLVKGPKSRLLWANRAFRDYYGMTNEELRGIIDAPFSEPDHTQHYVKDDSRVFETGQALDIPEEPVNRHDGEVHVFRTVKHPHRDPSGAVVGTFGISRDITGEMRRQKGARLLEHAIGVSSEGILVADATVPGNPVLYANASSERFLGAACAEILGQPLEQSIRRMADPAASSPLLAGIAARREAAVDFPMPARDGAAVWGRATISPVSDDRGQVVSFIAVYTDITAERQRQTQAQAIKEQGSLIERQQRAIVAMSTPIIEIWSGVLTMPLIGIVDSSRAAAMMESLLLEITRSRARFSIVDLTGVELVDTATANHLFNLVTAVGLLGCTCVLSGISPGISMTMVTLGVDLGRLRTFATLRSALAFAIGEMGMAVVRAPGPPDRRR